MAGRRLPILTVVATLLVTTSCIYRTREGPTVMRHPRQEDAYTITSVIQILNPVNPADMNDEF